MDFSNAFSDLNATQLILIVLLAANSFFLVRHFATVDKLQNVINKLQLAIGTLSTKLEALQDSDKEKTRLIQKLMSKIIKIQHEYIKLRSDFDNCNGSNCIRKEVQQ